jgi:hypothetical protein
MKLTTHIIAVALFAGALVVVGGCGNPTGGGGDGSNGASSNGGSSNGGGAEDTGPAEISIDLDDPSDAAVSFDGVSSEVARGSNLDISVSESFSSYQWYLDGASDNQALQANGQSATVDTSQLSLGTHSVSVFVDDGAYSAQVRFDVVNS